MGETIVFFRDDDVGEMTDPLRFHLDVLLERDIPCHYQVVPDYLDAECAGALRQLKQTHRDLLHFNQHGLHHEQTLNGEQVYSEFAGGRPFEDQLGDIRLGRERLEQALGDAFEGDVFTPPCHKYDRETLRALGELGFKTLSAGVRTDPASRFYYFVGHLLGRVELLGKRVSYHQRVTPEKRLTEVSVVIDVHEDQDDAGNRIDKDVDTLWGEFCAAREVLKAVGVMTHHQVCDTPARQAVLAEFVSRIAAEPGVRFESLRDLAPQSVAS
ncbi:MAG: DUF2334 domain-containing protein [Myxococcota bacterium]|jgi:hypothetical protein